MSHQHFEEFCDLSGRCPALDTWLKLGDEVAVDAVELRDVAEDGFNVFTRDQDVRRVSQRLECLHVLQHTSWLALETVAVSARDLNTFLYYNAHVMAYSRDCGSLSQT